MSTLHIITSLNDGGAEAVLFRLVTHDQGEHVVVSLGGADKYGPLLVEAGVPVHCLNMPKGRLTLGGLGKLFSLIKREKPVVVQTWMYHANLVGGLAAYLVGNRRIFWGLHHTVLVPGTTGRSTRIVDRFCAVLSGVIPKKIIACAEESRRVHVGNGYVADKITVIPNGYDLSLFAPDKAGGDHVRKALGIGLEERVVGLVGRWDPQKDHANLLSALQIVRNRGWDFHLVLAGNKCGPDNDDLVKLVEASVPGNRVHLLGRRSDVPAVMNALDLHVLASSHGEAFPNVVAEAMACGTPCVVTKVGDAADIVGNTGWSVPPKDPHALADAIVKAFEQGLNGRDWSARQTAARLRIAEHFSLDTMVARYRKAWEA